MSESRLRILTYHRVVDPADAPTTDRSLISATPEGFERQMRHLARRYRVISAAEALHAARTGRPLPDRAVMVTFDDAYRDVGEIAWPILRKFGLPATVFVPTAFPDHPERVFWWDQLSHAFALSSRAEVEVEPLGRLPLNTPALRRSSLLGVFQLLKRIPHARVMPLVERLSAALGDHGSPAGHVLGWGELRSLAREGLTLGGHTRTHAALDRLPIEAAAAEIRGSRDDLEREIGTAVPIFAYPFGVCDASVVEAVGEAGFELALTCADGHNPVPFTDPLRLSRTNVTTRTNSLLFPLRLQTFFSHVDRWRHRSERDAAGQMSPWGMETG